MPTVQYSQAVDLLFETLTEMRENFQRRSKELYGENLPQVIYGSVLPEHVELLSTQLSSSNKKNVENILNKIFDLLEIMCLDGDFETRSLVETGFLESLLLGNKDQFEDFRRYMGPETTKIAIKVYGYRR